MRLARIVGGTLLFLLVAVVGSAQVVNGHSGASTAGEQQIMDGGTCATPTIISAVPYTDTGTTVGKTNTVSTVGNGTTGCGTITHGFGKVEGPDVVYRFTVGTGNNLTFTVSTTSTTYDIDVYVLSVCGDGTTCVGGSDNAGDGGAETLNVSGLAPGTYYLYIDSFYLLDVARREGPYTLNVTGTLGNTAKNFFSLTPCRVADTRSFPGAYGPPPLAANGDRSFVMRGQCGIPATAQAVSINVTITQPTSAGDLRIFPGGSTVPLVSAINYRTGQTRANNATVALGTAGDITVHCDQVAGTVQFILDVDGYYQ